MFGFSKEQRDRRQRDANSTTMMLIVVIAVFLAVELPLSTMAALHTISSRWVPLWGEISEERRKLSFKRMKFLPKIKRNICKCETFSSKTLYIHKKVFPLEIWKPRSEISTLWLTSLKLLVTLPVEIVGCHNLRLIILFLSNTFIL